MKAIAHPSTNSTLGAPDGWDHNKASCDALPVTMTEYQPGGLPAIVSFWRPSDEDLAKLNAGGAVALWVIGRRHPPVAMGVEPHAAWDQQPAIQ